MGVHRSWVLLAVWVSAVTAPALPAQTPDSSLLAAPALAAGAATITAAKLAHYLGVLTADSMRDRATPSRGLERTARYVAEEFRKLGLRPRAIVPGSGTDNDWLQWYTLPDLRPRQINANETWLSVRVDVRARGKDFLDSEGRRVQQSVSLPFAKALRLATDTVSEGGLELRSAWEQERTLIVTGRQTPASLQRAKLNEPVLVYVPPTGLDTGAQRAVVAELLTIGNVVVLPNEDPATFAARRAAAATRPTVVLDRYLERLLGVRYWAVDIDPSAVETLLAKGGFDLATARADTVPRVREVRSLRVGLRLTFNEGRDTPEAMDVLGWIPGTDSVEQAIRSGRDEFLVYSASMDGLGPADEAGDSLAAGAADDVSGVAGLLALAHAFSQPGMQPRRSVLLLATSGRRRHFAGAHAVVTQWLTSDNTIPLNITLGALGAAGDTLAVAGLDEVELGTRPDWLAASHPELGLTVVDGGSVFEPTADHFAFVTRAIPSLYLSTGPARAPAGPAVVDAEAAARVLRFAFYLGQHVANRRPWPRWTVTPLSGFP